MPPAPPHLSRKHRPRGIEILYDDRDLLAVNKEPGVLTTGTRRDEAFTAENALNNYVRKGCARSSQHVYLVHRLGRETSGVLLFAKTEEAQQQIKDNWKSTEKFYLAAVYGHLKSPGGVFSSYLAENEDQYVYSVSNPGKGKLSQTAYTVIKATPSLSLVKIKLLTGHKNQIRVQFTEAGHAVVGGSFALKHLGISQVFCPARCALIDDEVSNGRNVDFQPLNLDNRGMGKGVCKR